MNVPVEVGAVVRGAGVRTAVWSWSSLHSWAVEIVTVSLRWSPLSGRCISSWPVPWYRSPVKLVQSAHANCSGCFIRGVPALDMWIGIDVFEAERLAALDPPLAQDEVQHLGQSHRLEVTAPSGVGQQMADRVALADPGRSVVAHSHGRKPVVHHPVGDPVGGLEEPCGDGCLDFFDGGHAHRVRFLDGEAQGLLQLEGQGIAVQLFAMLLPGPAVDMRVAEAGTKPAFPLFQLSHLSSYIPEGCLLS